MSRILVCSLVLAGAASAAVVSAPRVHPQAASGATIPVTIINQDTGSSERVDRDEVYDFNGSVQGWNSFGTGLQNDTWHVEPVGIGGAYTDVWWSADAGVGGYLSSSFVYLQTPAINMVGAVSPTLAFDFFYTCESPGGEPAGYNGWDGCNVWASTDGGATWSVISGTPAYNVSSSYAFGEEFGMGTGIPEWGGTAAGWAPASFDLSSFVGQSDVRLRFVMCADPAFDYLDDPTMIGMQVDNVVVSAGGTLWADDGVNNTGGAPSHSYYVYGDEWEHTGAEWTCNDGLSLGCFVESPWISATPPAIVQLEQDLRVDMPDSDGNDDGFLEDYFYVEYTTDGNIWTTLTYDYAGDTRPDWMDSYYTYTEADVFNGALSFTLSSETQFKIRYRMRTDGDTDGGDGTGLWVDNVNVILASVPTYDLAMRKAWIRYPRNVSVSGSWSALPGCEVENRGATINENVRVYWRVLDDSTNTTIRARQPLNQTAFVVAPLSKNRVVQTAAVPNTWEWFPAAEGGYRVQFWTEDTALFPDEIATNDSLEIDVYVFPQNEGILRYDYSTSSAWTIPSNDGETGRLVRFDPIAEPWTGQFFFARVYNMVAGDKVHFVIHSQGADSLTPGPVIGEYETTITGPEDIYPNTLIRYVGSIPELRCVDEELWMGLRSSLDNEQGIVGLSEEQGGPYWEGHTFSYNYNTSTATAWPGDLQMFLQVDWGIESVIPFDIELTGSRSGSDYTLSWDSPGPVDGYFVYRSTDGYFTPGTPLATLPAGTTTYTDTVPPTGRYFYQVVGYNGVCPVN